MGLEALGSIGTAVGSVASGIGKAGAGAAPAGVSLESMFGPKMGPIGVPSFAKEGPASFADMKNTMPLQIGQIKPVKEIRFNTPAEGETVASVENFLAQAKMPQVEPMVLPRVEPLVIPNGLKDPLPQIMASPALKPAIDAQAGQAVAVQPALQEEEVEEIVEEKVEKQEPEEVLLEEEATERKIIVEDGEVTAQRKLDIKVVAVKKAQELAIKLGLKKIPGRFIALFAPAEYPGVRSQLIKEKGPDGSYQETVEAIAGAGEFESVTAAQENVDKVIAEKKPGKYGKNGVQLAFEHVARIFKYRIFKSAQPHEKVTSRVAKKKVVTIPPAAPKKIESSIKDFPRLAEVFQKAA